MDSVSSEIELEKLLNLALRSPEVGAVNFNALHVVIAEIIKSLGLGNKLINVQNTTQFNGSNSFTVVGNGRVGVHSRVYDKNLTFLENKVNSLENKLKILEQLPSNVDIIKIVREKDTKMSVGNIWQFININRRLSATEEAIGKFSDLLEKAVSELDEIKDFKKELSDLKKIVTNIEIDNKLVKERLKKLEQSDNHEDVEKLKNVKDEIENLQNRIRSLATKKDLDEYMKWADYEYALKNGSIEEASRQLEVLPSNEVLKKIKEVGDLIHGHQAIIHGIQALQEKMLTKADKDDLETLRKKTQEVPDDLIKQLKKLHGKLEGLSTWKDENGRSLLEMEQSMKEFQDNLQRVNISVRNLVEDGDRKQENILSLQSTTETLDQTKADKDSVSMEMDTKAEKVALDNMISRLRFDTSVGGLEQSVQNILNRLSLQEAALKDAISKFNNEVDGKLDRLEIDPLKDYINKRIKANKCKHADLPGGDDFAAGMTKPAMKFHCISCARPVEIKPGMNVIPLPQYPAFPPSKSSRAYAPYELEQMRQNARGYYDGSDHVSTRPCGGQHTMTYSTRRGGKNVNYYYKEDEGIVISLKDDSTIQGQDGQVYKGREAWKDNEQLPTLHTSPPSPPRPPTAPSNPQTSPRTHTPVRPRSAVIR
ncbi:glutamine-rich protein 2-like isoform X2 [Xenia sp. Carnegie-2017]|uniref:glutamine-rich protein 2-like isoform X2 n=1 Tax=Xenia sp. Carnegie-2017 TaxID=2897299 RepID=UPI001F03F883|nr:glutamine-rich protein 2-like isoform X2 [Xenia sp. Carnegie-2017]